MLLLDSLGCAVGKVDGIEVILFCIIDCLQLFRCCTEVICG